MAYDKVVDSAALDAAMTYTANRIRNKTGDANQIAWDSAKGFGDAVDTITAGTTYDELPPKDTGVDWETFEGLYFVFNNNALPEGHPLRRMPCGFGGNDTYKLCFKIEFGVMNGTVFTPKAEATDWRYTYGNSFVCFDKVPDFGERFTVARVTALEGKQWATLWLYMTGNYNIVNTINNNFTIAVYGRVPSLTKIRSNKSDGAMLPSCIVWDVITGDRVKDNTDNGFLGMTSVREIIKPTFSSSQTNMDSMFQNCHSLTSLDISNFNTSSVTNMSYMFLNCNSLTSLDISNFDTSAVTNMSYMFQNCSSLTSLDISNFGTSSVTNMSYMFQNCSSLTSLDVSNFDTSAVTNMSYMFQNCNSLTSLDISNFDTSAVTNMNGMFGGCTNLTNFASCVFRKSIDFSTCAKLSHDSLMSIINNLAEVTNVQKLTLGTANKTKLTINEIAIATEKGWTVA